MLPSPEDFMGQVSVKYASVARAREIALKPTRLIIDWMILGDESALVDIRFWPHLKVGQIPGVPGWHYDVWNDPVKGKDDRHKIFILGADCRTEFQDKFIDEGRIFEYSGADLHRISPAGKSGPRIMIRCSWTRLAPKNTRLKGGHIAQG